MDLEEISDYCMEKTAVTSEVKFENLLCFCVYTKIFFAISLDENPLRATAKVGEALFDEWLSLPNMMQAPYFAKRQWITCNHIEAMSDKDCKEMIEISYRAIVSKFSKKKQAELLGDH